MKILSKPNIIRAIIIIFLCALIITGFHMFNKSSKAIVRAASTQSLKETAEFYARTFEIKINDQLSMLESQTRYFSDIDMNNYSVLKRTIMSTRGIGEFKRICVANSSGMTVNYQGHSSGNIYLTDYFKKVMETGRPAISKDITKDEDGEEVLVLAVPIIQEGKTKGVVTGSFSYSILGSLFAVSSFDGKGYSDIVSNQGQLIVSSAPNYYGQKTVNIFENAVSNKSLKNEVINQIKNDMQQNKSSFASFFIDDDEKLCYYTPVGVNDWYVFSYVQYDYIKKLQSRIALSVYALIAVLVLVFVVIIGLYLHLQKEREEARHDVEKYAIANEQNRSCLFEYDLRTRKIKFTGNYEYVFGKIKNPIELLEFRKLYVNIHDDDKNVMLHMNDFFAEKQMNFSSELRFRCRDGEFRWFRLSGSCVTDDNETEITKFIGTFTNVDAQMLHEQELRYIAETDMLSGLLNKGFFQKNVKRFIASPPENSTGAFFIIDLDNFKATNDTLGHAMGDMAIRDAAQKISLIFSQKDILGRIGGDEFCVFMILENVTQNTAAKIIMEKAASLNENLQEYYSNEKKSVQISASIGISLWPQQGSDFDELFHCADSALYYVKQHGKDGNAIFSNKMKQGERISL